MNRLYTSFILLFLFASSVSAQNRDPNQPISRIAFGSCAKEDRPQPIWENIVKQNPEMFLFIGDNIYGDTNNMKIMRQKWAMLGDVKGYKLLKKQCPILATWDDHDYGENDGGVSFSAKRESQQVFLDFFDEPADSPRRKQEGIYDAKMFGPEGKRIQIILLDTRYFRSPLVKSGKTYTWGSGIHGPYGPSPDLDATVLGQQQWKWLEEQLRQPAELRIIASSIQVISNQHGWEKWGNFPRERKRLTDLIAKTKAGGVVIISGDRHRGEASRMTSDQSGIGYPLYDVTSSSLNQPQKWRNEINPHRVGSIFCEVNFGTINIDWNADDPIVQLEIRNIEGKSMIEIRHKLSELHPAK